MRMVLREIRKSPFRLMILLIIVILLMVINALVADYWITRSLADTTAQYIEAYDHVYGGVEGTITREKLEWIVSEKERLNALVYSGEFSTEEDLAGTYTGYVYSDNNLIDELYEDIRYAYEYSDYSREIVRKAKDNATLYERKGSGGIAARYSAMAQAFEGRKIGSFYRTNGWDGYFGYKFSNLTSMLLIILCLSPLFSLEAENGMDVLLSTTQTGKRKTSWHKVKTSLVCTCLVTTIFSIQDFWIFASTYKFCGFNTPIYAIPEFRNSMLTVNIGVYVFINYLLKLFGMWTFSTMVMLSSVVSKSNMSSFALSVSIFVVEILLSFITPWLSCITLFNSISLCAEFGGVFILDSYLPDYEWVAIVQFGRCCFIAAIACLVSVKPSCGIRKGKNYASAPEMGMV